MVLDHTVKYNGVFYYAGQELPEKVASTPATDEPTIENEIVEAPKPKRGRKKAEE